MTSNALTLSLPMVPAGAALSYDLATHRYYRENFGGREAFVSRVPSGHDRG